ncbi:MAG TPA: Xaa-Pro peptidase family protein [Verrucomicrobiae bacterium]|nr:Xaa-Pro peptidase family protein [Verrucomicrobiae bacterium]
MSISRRALLGLLGAGAVAAGAPAFAARSKTKEAALPRGPASPAKPASLTKDAKPITAEEHGARIAKLQSLLRQRKAAALLVEAGASLEYFTGIRWHRSERTTAAVIPADGGIVAVTPAFEEPSVRETLKIQADVRTWKEDESPFDLLAGALRDRVASDAPLAVEGTTRYFIVDRLAAAKGGPGRNVVSGDDLVRACRIVKSPAERALLQTANDVTIAAIRSVHGKVEAGMGRADVMKLLVEATEALGGAHQFSLVLLNEASAYPHGSEKPQTIAKGSVVLIDSGCSVQGYQSDISRTWIFGEPTARQREVWNTVKRGQELALETAKLGAPVGDVDRAVRAFYEGKGWGKDYALPGTSHRTGHGIGMDGHEAPYLVRSDTTPLEAGMCFSDEPGIYIPGEFGIRLEDCWVMTESGPKLFTPLATSIDQPI